MSELSKQELVMDLSYSDSLLAIFDMGDDRKEMRQRIALQKEDWEGMGSPDKITVTVLPGDRLNNENSERITDYASEGK